MYSRHTFATRLKQLREEKKLSQTDLADKIGVSRGSISFYEKEERVPDIEILFKLATFFNISTDWLIGLVDNKLPDNWSLGKKTGLSDTSIEILSEKHKNSFYISTVNYILQDETFLKYVGNYLFKTIVSEVFSSDYMFLIKDDKVLHGLNPKDHRVYFANIIEYLPKFKENFEKDHLTNADMKKEFIYEYIAKKIDVKVFEKSLLGIEHQYEEPDNQDYSDLFFDMESEYEQLEKAHNESLDFQNKMSEIELDFLDYLYEKKYI